MSREPSTRTSRLARQLARLRAEQRRQLHREDIVRMGNDADQAQFAGGDAQNPENSNLLPNKLPETPMNQENGNLIGGLGAASELVANSPAIAKAVAAEEVAARAAQGEAVAHPAGQSRISCHEPENSGNQEAATSGHDPKAATSGRGSPETADEASCSRPDSQEAQLDPLAELLDRAIAAAQVRRGRPRAFDEHAKGQLTALLSVGMSMRQAASVLGVSHTTVQKTLKADPELTDEITAARFQAQLHPLACIIREARRSWKAATWLLKYLDQKIATHEETPEECRQRGIRETEEFFARPTRSSTRQRS